MIVRMAFRSRLNLVALHIARLDWIPPLTLPLHCTAFCFLLLLSTELSKSELQSRLLVTSSLNN